MTTLIPKFDLKDGGATPAGAVNRPINQKLQEIISVKDFGAVGNGVTNDAAAIQAALNAVVALSTGGELFFPDGNYNIGSALTIAVPQDKSLTLTGTGEGSTVLSFSGNTNGIVVTLGIRAGCIASNFSIIRTNTSSAIANTAFSITGDATAVNESVRVSNLTFKGNTARTTAWLTNLRLADLGKPTVDSITIISPDADGSILGTGISIYGTAFSAFTTDVKISNIQIVGGRYGIDISGYVQGVYLTNSTIIGIQYGVNWGDPGKFGQLLAISNSHINSRDNGVITSGATQVLISNNLFLRFTDAFSTWSAIYLIDAITSSISGNVIYGNLVAGENGILLTSTSVGTGEQPSSVIGNIIAAIDGAGVALTGDTVLTAVKSNIMNGVLGGGVDNGFNPDGNYIFDNVVNPSGNNGTNFQERSGSLLLGNLLNDTTAQLNINGASGYPLATGVQSTASTNQITFFNPNGVVGSIQTSGSATSYVTSSDYRLKENVTPMTGALTKVAALKPVKYDWKVDGSSGQGFIAHELQAVIPECVTGTKDQIEDIGNIKDSFGNIVQSSIPEPKLLKSGQIWEKTGDRPRYQGVDTSFLVATLTAAIQELKAEVDALKAK